MKFKNYIWIWILAPGLLVTGCSTVNVSVHDPNYFPMTTGSRWVYELHAEINSTGAIVTNDLFIACEILETVEKDGVTTALFNGFPTALDVLAEGTNFTGRSLLIRIPGGQYHTRNAMGWPKFKDPDKMLFDVVNENTLLFDGPLVAGTRFGDYAQIARSDMAYFTYVESVEKTRIRGIKGIPFWRKYTIYHLRYRTNPGEEWTSFAPGIGILEYRYHHNGIPSDVRVRLKEFHSP